ncbi:transposase, partial [Niveispirillum lacus]
MAAAHALILALQGELATARQQAGERAIEIERLRLALAKARRELYGQSSERGRLLVEQLELQLEELEETSAENEVAGELSMPVPTPAVTPRKPARRPLPEALPRERVVHPGPCVCDRCGGNALRKIGEDVLESLECEPRRWKVVQHVREKFACRSCEAVSQAPAPSHPIRRGRAGPNLLAMVLAGKYAQHLPLHRQSAAYAREGIDLDVSTLADWVGAAAATLAPLVAAIRSHVLSAARLHGDDTPVPVLAKGKTATGRLWVYVRDDRPCGGSDPPAALYHYARTRAGEHPQRHLAGWTGIFQADAYSGYAGL